MSGCFDNYAIFTTTAGLRLRCFLDRASHKVLKGHGFTGCGKTHSQRQEASGHDFSRAVSRLKSMRALAPDYGMERNEGYRLYKLRKNSLF